jgi:hypothetical protein
MPPARTVAEKRSAVNSRITKLKKQPAQNSDELNRLEALLAKKDEDLDQDPMEDIIMEDNESPDAGHSQTGGDEQSSATTRMLRKQTPRQQLVWPRAKAVSSRPPKRHRRARRARADLRT